MRWHVCTNGDELLRRRNAALTENESLYNLTWAAIARSRQPPPTAPGYAFLTLEDDQCSIAHGFVNHGAKLLVLSAMPATAVDTLVPHIQRHAPTIETVEGPTEHAHRFAQCWTENTNQAYTIIMRQGLYELTRLIPPKDDGGRLVRATAVNEDLLRDFFKGFCIECFPNDPVKPEAIHARITRLIAEGKGYLWQSSRQALVSMAAIVRETPNTSSISLVYTPPEHRGKGYAAQVVGSVSQAQFSAGKQACNLHTDLENGTSNRVYQRLGYTMIQQSARIRLPPKT